MREVEEDQKISQGKTFFKHILSRAYKNDGVAISILKKLVPDKTFNIEEFRSEHPLKIIHETIDSRNNLKNDMINSNKKGIRDIFVKVKGGQLEIEEGIARLGDELLKETEEEKRDDIPLSKDRLE